LAQRHALMRALEAPYVITDSTLRAGRGHLEVARQALAGGARIIQLRDKRIGPEAQTDIARELVSMAHAAGALLIVNDLVEVALGAGADGVHVGRSDIPAAEARARLGPEAIIGATVDTADEARAAEVDGADYVGVGPVFATATKPDAGTPVGLEHLRAMRDAVGIGVVAIGGITAGNVALALAAGADGAAVISAIVSADDMERATREIAAAMARFRKGTQV
jgi:thiamine-phosphate pyrophosphorylase